MSDDFDQDEYQGVVSALITDAERYIDDDIAPQREYATRLYQGAPFGNEQEGRSSIVLPVVRDVTNQSMPSMMRTFCGSEQSVEFAPRNEFEVEQAQEQTDAINYIFFEQNGGYNVHKTAFKDAFVRKTGIYFWEPVQRKSVREFFYDDVPEADFKLLEASTGEKIVSATLQDTEKGVTAAQADPRNAALDPMASKLIDAMVPGVFAPLPKPEKLYRVRTRRTVTENRVRVVALAPETFFISRDAACVRTAACVGVRQEVTVSDLVSLGYDFDEVLEHAGSAHSLSDTNMEALTRNPFLDHGLPTVSDPALQKVRFVQAWVRVDKDGDGIAELRHICAIGETHHILSDDIFEEEFPPFSLIAYDDEPHNAIGYGLADQVGDVQIIMSNMMRDTLDSAKQSIFPRTAAVETQVNMDDVMNTDLGAVIRMRAPGMVQELATTFIGPQMMPLLQHMESVLERRTGINAASLGLNGDELQSTTAVAVSAQTSAAQQRLEMIARNWAEGGIKEMYEGILRTVVRHIREPMQIKTRSGFKLIDPRNWIPDLPVRCNVGLGKGNDAERAQMLAQVLQVQEKLLGASLDNPLVGAQELRNTLVALLELSGVRDTTKFFKPVDPNWKPPAQEKVKDPQTLLAEVTAQVEALKANVDREKFLAEDQFKLLKLKLDDDFRRDQMAQEFELKKAEIESKYGAQVNGALVQAEVDHRRMDVEQAMAELSGEQKMAETMAGLYADSVNADADRQAAQVANATAELDAAPMLPPPDETGGLI